MVARPYKRANPRKDHLPRCPSTRERSCGWFILINSLKDLRGSKGSCVHTEVESSAVDDSTVNTTHSQVWTSNASATPSLGGLFCSPQLPGHGYIASGNLPDRESVYGPLVPLHHANTSPRKKGSLMMRYLENKHFQYTGLAPFASLSGIAPERLEVHRASR